MNTPLPLEPKALVPEILRSDVEPSFSAVPAMEFAVIDSVKTETENGLNGVAIARPAQEIAVSVEPEKPSSDHFADVSKMVYADKLEALHGAMLEFQRALAAIATSDDALRASIRATHKSVVLVLRQADDI